MIIQVSVIGNLGARDHARPVYSRELLNRRPIGGRGWKVGRAALALVAMSCASPQFIETAYHDEIDARVRAMLLGDRFLLYFQAVFRTTI